MAALDIAPEQKQQLQAEARHALLVSVEPAYRKLIAVLNDLNSQAEVEGGADATARRAFYRHALRQTTTTEMDADSIHRLGLREAGRIRDEMKAALKQFGYDGELVEFLNRTGRTDAIFPQTAAGKQATSMRLSD